MPWVTYASPQSLSRRKTTRRINLNTATNSAIGTLDSINTLNAVYKGRTDRIQRYTVYDQMDQDSDVARALDLMAEHCAPQDEESELPFEIKWNAQETTEEQTTVVNEHLDYWIKLNEFRRRIRRNVRAVLKYGDWFYWRNPKTFELYNLHPKLVIGAVVDQEKLEILAWIVRGVKFNIEDGELVNANMSAAYDNIRQSLSQSGLTADCRVIPAINIIQLSLNEGKFSGIGSDDEPTQSMVSRWPFGDSVLENMYKTFKQRELLEDAVLIHRFQRAPTRRVWYLDVGKNRGDRAKWIINDFRNEMNQRRIPQQFGADGRQVDSIYNPMSTLEDYYIPVTTDGKSAKVENLEGQSWNDIPELKYMTQKMFRAARVPYSMMVGPEEGGSVFNDAKVGTAYMEEIEFSKFCKSIQQNIDNEFDFEFKMFCKWTDVPVNVADFEVKLIQPTNYQEYLQNMRDQDNITIWSQIKDDPSVSSQFAKIKYLKWTKEDLLMNEKMFIEENFPMNNPLHNDAGTMGAAPMGGGGDPLGGLPPPPGEEPGDMDAMGGMDGGAMGAPPAGLDSGAGGLGAAGAPAPSMNAGVGEARTMTKMMIAEEDFALSDIEPAPTKQLPKTGIYKDRTQDDNSFMTNDPVKGQATITFEMIRHLRRMHMQRRIENQKRLRVVQKVYAKVGDAAGGMGGPPTI